MSDLRYTVFSIDTSRRHYTDALHGTLREFGWVPLYTRCVNARWYDDLEKEIARRGVAINNDTLTRGEVAIWLTMLNGIENAPVVTFEDDAIIDGSFQERFNGAMEELPDDADLFSLFIPRDSDHMYSNEHDLGLARVCKAYQNYGGVSMYVTESGAEKVSRLVAEDGITDQWDNQIYGYARSGKLNVYTSNPIVPDIVWISGHDQTTVHNTETFVS